MSERSVISTRANALDSLRRFSAEIAAGPPATPISLKGLLWWGWHAVAVLAHLRLGAARAEFDTWLWKYLPEEGSSAIDVGRDALWEERERLSLLEIVDLLSAEDLPILKPEFYQGWQDRRTRCRTLRRQAAEVLGKTIGDEERQALLLLLAAYHRLLRLPAAVELETGPLVDALPELCNLLEMLVDRSDVEGDALVGAIEECRTAVRKHQS
ncbi:MAG: hypothetical protein GY856_08275 [bacterium]|nr:hypothetical protein [bacterium]